MIYNYSSAVGTTNSSKSLVCMLYCICVLAPLCVGWPVSNTVCEHTTDAFCMLKIGWREETMHVEGKEERREVPPFSLMILLLSDVLLAHCIYPISIINNTFSSLLMF